MGLLELPQGCPSFHAVFGPGVLDRCYPVAQQPVRGRRHRVCQAGPVPGVAQPGPQIARHVQQQAGRFSGALVAVDYAGNRTGSVPVDSGKSKSPAVENSGVSAPVVQTHRVVRRGPVEVPPGGMAFFGKGQVVVAEPPDPIS